MTESSSPADDQRFWLSQGEPSSDEVPSEGLDEWLVVANTRNLSPYVCKASFVCGLMRELIASSVQLFQSNRHLGALFLGLDAAELLGRCLGEIGGPKARLIKGLTHLDSHYPDRLAHSVEDYERLRNFTGHGAAHGLAPGLRFREESTASLLECLARALNDMWADADLTGRFAGAQVQPLYVSGGMYRQPQPIYIDDIQTPLQGGARPGDELLGNLPQR